MSRKRQITNLNLYILKRLKRGSQPMFVFLSSRSSDVKINLINICICIRQITNVHTVYVIFLKRGSQVMLVFPTFESSGTKRNKKTFGKEELN